MDKLKPATLTSSLLATKGAATPAEPGSSARALIRLLPFMARPRLVASQVDNAGARPKSAKGRARKNGSAANGKNGVNVSFRLDPDRHLRLKILATHHHGSMRECLEEAVELYLASNGPAVRGGGCPCVADRGKSANQPITKECV